MTTLLLCVAGVLLQSYAALVRADPGFDPRNQIVFTVSAPAPRSIVLWVALVVLATVVAAADPSARRAARVDPANALRG